MINIAMHICTSCYKGRKRGEKRKTEEREDNKEKDGGQKRETGSKERLIS